MLLRSVLPEEHLSTDSKDSKDVVKVSIALVATMAALLLGLPIASAKGAYDTRRNQLLQVSADMILLDRALAHYGTEAKEARAMLQRSANAAIEQFRPANGARPGPLDREASSVESLYDHIQRLSPQSEAQRSLQNQTLTMALNLARTRVLLFEQLDLSIPVPLIVALVFWLCLIFASFGLFAPKNVTVIAAFFVCALSVSSAIFLILELDRSFEGVLRVSSDPLRAALAQLGR